MATIPYYYESLDRNAIVVKKKKPFFSWLNKQYPDTRLDEDIEGTVYLISEKENNEEIEDWLTRRFDLIFVNELNDWHTDSDDWPGNRTYELFKEWFNVEIHSVVLDLEDDDIVKE